MTGTELRWSSIDGTEWTASAGEVRFLVCLVEIGSESVYQAYAIAPPEPIHPIGTYDTINEAKAACLELEYLK